VRRLVAALGLVACALGIGTRVARAQASGDLFAEAMRAYRNVEFDLAAGLLRREVARLAAGGAPAADRARALAYLGAADLFRGRRDSAAAVFGRLIALDPRYRPDRLIFPPDVTALFDRVRQETKAVLVAVPRDTEIALGAQSVGVWLIASSLHTIDVTLRYEDGAPFRVLYTGPIGDSLQVQWDGLDAVGGPPTVRRVLLRVASRQPTGEPAGTLELPLGLRVLWADTLAWPAAPADSLFLPERSPREPAMRALMGGAVLSSAVIALPTLVGGNQVSSGPRIAVAGTIALAGVVGYVLHRPGRPLERNIRANRALHEAWEQRAAGAKAENARRRRDVRLAIHAGPPVVKVGGP